MKRLTHSRLVFLIAVMGAGAFLCYSTASADVITDWNQTTIELIQANMQVSTKASRTLASVHVAMYDAVNAVERTHMVFYSNVLPVPGASAEAAAACAAYRVLIAMFPDQSEQINLALTASLDAIPDGPAKLDGISLGNEIGIQIFDWREGDHAMDMIPYTPGSEPGRWRPTPPDFLPAMLPQWGFMTPFVLNPAHYILDPPPELSGEQYATEVNQIKSLGAKVSAERTEMQTMTANFWADMPGTVTTVGRWNQIAQDLAETNLYSLDQSARLFAVLNTALADAGIIAWHNKYYHEFWRPVSAIREADSDNNPLTEADPAWESLLTTPAFPEYPSAHSTFSGAAAEILALSHEQDEFDFTVPSFMNPAMTRSYTSFSSAAAEAGMSRLYGGIHFASANTRGIELGNRIASDIWSERFQTLQNAAEIRISEPVFEDGESFSIIARLTNAETSSSTLSEYIVLDVLGSFWFWPDWSSTPSAAAVTLSPQEVLDQTILEFKWPGNMGELENIRFWIALIDPVSGEVFGSYDMNSFSCK